MKKLIVIILLLPSLAFGADYAITFADGAVWPGIAIVVNGGGTHACVNIQSGSDVTLINSTLANCADDAINVAEDAAISNTVTWCESDAACTNTVASGKTVTEDHNAHRVQFAGDGTVDGEEDNLTLTACPFANCYGNLRTGRGSALLDAGTGTFTDERGRTGNDIGYWQHVVGMIKIVGKFLKIHSP